MVMYFTEEDLVSFGSYLLSDVRKQHIRSSSEGLSDKDIENRLKNVNDADLGNWAYLVNQAKEEFTAEQN
jgi:hypothetical protein